MLGFLTDIPDSYVKSKASGPQSASNDWSAFIEKEQESRRLQWWRRVDQSGLEEA